MNKSQLLDLINRCYLDGVNSRMLITTVEGLTKVRCISDDMNLITDITYNKFFEDGESIGIYNVDLFQKFLGLVNSEEINYLFEKNANVNYKLHIKTSVLDIEYGLCDPLVIPKAPEKFKKDPVWHIEFKIDHKISTTIQQALQVTKSYTFKLEKIESMVNIIIGNLSTKENIVKIQLPCIELNKSDKNEVTFLSSYFNNILNVSKEGVMKVTFDGMYNFINENKDTNNINEYYQKAIVIK